LEFDNYRIVPASQYSTIPTLKYETEELKNYSLSNYDRERIQARNERRERRLERREQRRQRRSGEEIESDENENIVDLNDENSGTFIDQSIRARVGNVWNPVAMPLKLPINMKRYKKLSNGELISYNTYGYIEAGMNAGFNIKPEILDMKGRSGINAGYKVYLRGNYQITILKESDRFASVKVHRIATVGNNFNIRAQANNFVWYDGYILFEGEDYEQKVLRQNFAIIPFNFTYDHNISQSFELAYRYDLNFPEAQEAFKNAIFGAYGRSQEYEGRIGELEDGEKSVVVQKLLRKTSTDTQAQHLINFNLKLIMKKSMGRKKTTAAVIEMPAQR
jgi:hypothetical protein